MLRPRYIHLRDGFSKHRDPKKPWIKPGWLDTTVWPYRLKKINGENLWNDVPPEALPKQIRQEQKKIQKEKKEKELAEKKRRILEKKLQIKSAKEKKAREIQERQEARIANGGKPRGRPKKKTQNTS